MFKEKKQKQWEREKETVELLRAEGPRLKALARARGYPFRFFDYLDSYRTVFTALADEARKSHPSLVAITEVPQDEYRSLDVSKCGIAPDWVRIVFSDGNSAATTYNDPDSDANINGVTQAFEQPDGAVRTVVLVAEAVRCRFRHRDLKYHFKLIALLHELGHVDDFEKQINFNISTRTVNIISAEIYAHRHALAEANRLGLFMVATTLIDTLMAYIDGEDYRAEVARRVIEEYQPPIATSWSELTSGEITTAELALMKRMS